MADVLGPATLAITQGISAFHSFLPPFTEIRRHSLGDDVAFAKDVRMGEVAAVATTMGIGVISSSLTGSPIPTYVAGISALLLVVLYESALRSTPEGADNAAEPAN